MKKTIFFEKNFTKILITPMLASLFLFAATFTTQAQTLETVTFRLENPTITTIDGVPCPGTLAGASVIAPIAPTLVGNVFISIPLGVVSIEGRVQGGGGGGGSSEGNPSSKAGGAGGGAYCAGTFDLPGGYDAELTAGRGGNRGTGNTTATMATSGTVSSITYQGSSINGGPGIFSPYHNANNTTGPGGAGGIASASPGVINVTAINGQAGSGGGTGGSNKGGNSGNGDLGGSNITSSNMNGNSGCNWGAGGSGGTGKDNYAGGSGGGGFAEISFSLYVPVVTVTGTAICAGSSFTLEVVAPMTGWTYTWYKIGNPTPLTTGYSYTVTNANATHQGNYYVVASIPYEMPVTIPGLSMLPLTSGLTFNGTDGTLEMTSANYNVTVNARVALNAPEVSDRCMGDTYNLAGIIDAPSTVDVTFWKDDARTDPITNWENYVVGSGLSGSNTCEVIYVQGEENGCTNTAIEYKICPLPKPVISFTPASYYCIGEIIDLADLIGPITPSPAVAVAPTVADAQWYVNNYSGTALSNYLYPMPSSSTKLILYIEYNNGCSDTASVTITPKPIPAISLNNPPFRYCELDVVNLGDVINTIASTGNPRSIRYYDEATHTQVPNQYPMAIGPHPSVPLYVITTDDTYTKCQDTAHFELVRVSTPQIDVLSDAYPCEKATINLNDYVNVAWQNGETPPLAPPPPAPIFYENDWNSTPVAGGIFTLPAGTTPIKILVESVIPSGAPGPYCRDTAEFTINPRLNPSIDFPSPMPTFCDRDTIVLDDLAIVRNGITRTYYDDNMTQITALNSAGKVFIVAANTPAGSSDKTVTIWVNAEDAFGCDSLAPMHITVHSSPSYVINSDKGAICFEEEVTFWAESGFADYDWDIADATEVYRSTAGDTIVLKWSETDLAGLREISLIVEDTNGCKPEYPQATDVVVKDYVLPVITIELQSAGFICEGGNLTFNVVTADLEYAGTAPQYLWYINEDPAVPAATGPSFICQPTLGDSIRCRLTSNYHCANPEVVFSNTIIVNEVISTPITTLCLDAYMGEPIDLNDAVTKLPGLVYSFYADEPCTIPVPDPTNVVFTDVDVRYYVRAQAAPGGPGYCYGPVGLIRLCESCDPTVWVGTIEYKVTSLAGLCWTENLHHGTGVPYPGAPVTDNFGWLYTWDEAVNGTTPNANGAYQGICPPGWHIPLQAEWLKLTKYFAPQLKSKNHWVTPPGNGTDNFGFTALPAGWFNSGTNRFEDLYGYTGWWTSDSGSATTSDASLSYFCDKIQTLPKSKTDKLSVRCVRD